MLAITCVKLSGHWMARASPFTRHKLEWVNSVARKSQASEDISIAVTSAPVFNIALVRVPGPGPTSRTLDTFPRPNVSENSTDFCMGASLIRKFCPSDLSVLMAERYLWTIFDAGSGFRRAMLKLKPQP